MIVMKDGSDLQKILNSVLAEMQELEQENMDKEDENARLLQQLLVAREDTYVAIDAERLRAWKENKAFQYDLAEQNAQLRKQLGEKHDDNARLQRSLAEEHNKLKVALQLQPQEDVDFKDHVGTDYWWQTETDYKLIVDKVNTLWEERRVGVKPPMKMEMDDNPDYFVREIDDTGGTGLVYKIESDGDAVRFTASNGTYNDYIELPLDIAYDLMVNLKVSNGGQFRY